MEWIQETDDFWRTENQHYRIEYMETNGRYLLRSMRSGLQKSFISLADAKRQAQKWGQP